MGEVACVAHIRVLADHQAVPRHEFDQYETALCISCLPLESKSTPSGFKDFIAVGTIITRGEDLATRGAVSATDGAYWAQR